MTLPDLAALESLAKAATPGPWLLVGKPGDSGILASLTPLVSAYGDYATPMGFDNMAFCAAAHPGTVLALIAEVRRLRALVQEAYTEAQHKTGAFYGGTHWLDSDSCAKLEAP